MTEQILTMIGQGKIGWTILGAIGLIAGVFAVYYITFAIYLIVTSIYSGVKLLPESFRIWREEWVGAHETSWAGAQLGVTMPDGGEPVEKKEEAEKKGKEKEA